MSAIIPRTSANEPVTTQSVPLSAIPGDWDDAWADLATRASEPNPFAEHWFMRPAIAAFGSEGAMLSVWQGTQLLGLFPLCEARHYGRLPIRHIQNWLHYHSFLGTPLIRAGHEKSFWASAIVHLDADSGAKNFFHINGLDPNGPVFAALQAVRRADIVHRSERAMLSSTLAPAEYYETNVRQKKRKEIRRLSVRLAELGKVRFDNASSGAEVEQWCATYLALEAAGWKGREGTALGDEPSTRTFFCEALAGAAAAGRLDMLRLTLDGRPIAMLVNFMTPPGSYSFKIAFDEEYARFSPGVLIQIENLKVLERSGIDWMDSCAVEDHPMINSLWAERREIVRVTVPLKGARRMAAFHVARALERASAFMRGLQ